MSIYTDISSAIEEVKQKLTAVSHRLKRYDARNDQYRINKMFRENPQKVYRKIPETRKKTMTHLLRRMKPRSTGKRNGEHQLNTTSQPRGYQTSYKRVNLCPNKETSTSQQRT